MFKPKTERIEQIYTTYRLLTGIDIPKDVSELENLCLEKGLEHKDFAKRNLLIEWNFDKGEPLKKQGEKEPKLYIIDWEPKPKSLKKQNDIFKKGFSLIEMIAVVSIGAVLVSVVLFSFSSFRNSKTIDISADQVLSVINEARVKAVSSEDYSRFGVHFEVGKAVFFKGDSYSSQNSANVEMELSPLVEISDISFNGGGSDIVFQKLTGKTSNYGSLRIRLKSDNNKYKTISVKSTGIANVQ